MVFCLKRKQYFIFFIAQCLFFSIRMLRMHTCEFQNEEVKSRTRHCLELIEKYIQSRNKIIPVITRDYSASPQKKHVNHQGYSRWKHTQKLHQSHNLLMTGSKGQFPQWKDQFSFQGHKQSQGHSQGGHTCGHFLFLVWTWEKSRFAWRHYFIQGSVVF